MPADEPVAKPFLKWAGGKWAIAADIEALLPRDARERTWREPFMGSAAMFFWMRPERAYLSDALHDLVATFKVVRDRVEPLIDRLTTLKATHSDEQFYAIRERFNADKKAQPVDRAAWLIYLNKTCFNGLFRTNSKGMFNVPVGRMSNPRIVDPKRLRMASAILEHADIEQRPFDQLVTDAKKGDVVYLDPPYVPLSKTSNFSGYSDGVFTLVDQKRLADVFKKLDKKGCLLALSNSDTPEVRELYAGYDLKTIVASRAISSKASTRGETRELLVRNVKRYP